MDVRFGKKNWKVCFSRGFGGKLYLLSFLQTFAAVSLLFNFNKTNISTNETFITTNVLFANKLAMLNVDNNC